MKSYTFTLFATGNGSTPDEAWQDAQKTLEEQLQGTETPQTYFEYDDENETPEQETEQEVIGTNKDGNLIIRGRDGIDHEFRF